MEGIPCETTFDGYHKTGEILHLRVKSIPLISKGEIHGVFSVVKNMTDYFNTQASLNRMQERFKAVFHSAADAIDIVDLDGNIIDVNHGFEKLYGWKRDEVIGKPLPIIPRKRQDEFKSFVERAKKGEEIKEFDVSAIRKDGELIDISLTFSPILDVDKNVIAFTGIARDMTKLNQLKFALNESEERYRKVVEYSPKGILVQRDGEIIYANPVVSKVLKETNLVGKSIFSYINPTQYAAYKKRISVTKAGVELPFIEMRMIRADGKEIFVELGGISIYFDGSPAILTMFNDVTERKQIEKALQTSEERYRLLADNSLDLIQLVSLDGMVTYASPAHETVLGYKPEEYVGKWVLYQPATGVDKAFKDKFKAMALTKQAFTTEIVRRHKKGNEVWIELKGTPVFDTKGNIKYLMLIGREITKRKKLQEYLKYISFHDPLTGVPNRRYFNEKLKRTIKNAEKCNSKFAVMYMDVDKFKLINDTCGHDAGDEFLINFSKRVKAQLREGDIIARQGGDEFMVILKDIEEKDAYLIAGQILHSLKEPWEIGVTNVQLTSSIGIAFYPKDGTTVHELITHADAALYDAKRDGRNNYKTFSNDNVINLL